MSFKANPNLARAIAGSDEGRAATKAAAEQAATLARRYKRSILPRKGAPGREGIAVIERDGEVYLSNFDHGAHWDEWGNYRLAPGAPLRRACIDVGLSFEEESR